MDFSPGMLLLSLIIGTIGLALAAYGRKQPSIPHLSAGVILMVFPYFVSSVGVMLVIAGAILVALFVARRAGW